MDVSHTVRYMIHSTHTLLIIILFTLRMKVSQTSNRSFCIKSFGVVFYMTKDDTFDNSIYPILDGPIFYYTED